MSTEVSREAPPPMDKAVTLGAFSKQLAGPCPDCSISKIR